MIPFANHGDLDAISLASAANGKGEGIHSFFYPPPPARPDHVNNEYESIERALMLFKTRGQNLIEVWPYYNGFPANAEITKDAINYTTCLGRFIVHPRSREMDASLVDIRNNIDFDTYYSWTIRGYIVPYCSVYPIPPIHWYYAEAIPPTNRNVLTYVTPVNLIVTRNGDRTSSKIRAKIYEHYVQHDYVRIKRSYGSHALDMAHFMYQSSTMSNLIYESLSNEERIVLQSFYKPDLSGSTLRFTALFPVRKLLREKMTTEDSLYRNTICNSMVLSLKDGDITDAVHMTTEFMDRMVKSDPCCHGIEMANALRMTTEQYVHLKVRTPALCKLVYGCNVSEHNVPSNYMIYCVIHSKQAEADDKLLSIPAVDVSKENGVYLSILKNSVLRYSMITKDMYTFY